MKLKTALIQPIADVRGFPQFVLPIFFFIYLLLSFCFLFLSRNLLLSSSNCSLSSTSILCSKLEIDLDLALKLEIDLDLALKLDVDLDLALGPAKKLLERSWLSSSTFCRRRLLGLVPDLIGVFKAFLSYQDPQFHNVKSFTQLWHSSYPNSTPKIMKNTTKSISQQNVIFCVVCLMSSEYS